LSDLSGKSVADLLNDLIKTDENVWRPAESELMLRRCKEGKSPPKTSTPIEASIEQRLAKMQKRINNIDDDTDPESQSLTEHKRRLNAVLSTKCCTYIISIISVTPISTRPDYKDDHTTFKFGSLPPNSQHVHTPEQKLRDHHETSFATGPVAFFNSAQAGEKHVCGDEVEHGISIEIDGKVKASYKDTLRFFCAESAGPIPFILSLTVRPAVLLGKASLFDFVFRGQIEFQCKEP